LLATVDNKLSTSRYGVIWAKHDNRIFSLNALMLCHSSIIRWFRQYYWLATRTYDSLNPLIDWVQLSSAVAEKKRSWEFFAAAVELHYARHELIELARVFTERQNYHPQRVWWQL